MTCITTKLNILDFPMHEGGLIVIAGGGLCILFTLYLWNFIISASRGIFLDRAHKNNRII